eukprot:m.40795 g.40795  ORF g.40795 m.40795 type:complete len:320 (-) comp10398_c0_seq1:29-988(-)
MLVATRTPFVVEAALWARTTALIRTSLPAPPCTTTISPAAIGVINISPLITRANSFGSETITCGYTCDLSSNQGGCNTADQVLAYFRDYVTSTLGVLSSSLRLYMYFTQYSCWKPTTISLSTGSTAACCTALTPPPPPPPLYCANASTHNLVIISNYQGGAVTINIDQNISNIYIGVTTYQITRITLAGDFAANVRKIIYAGMNANTNCAGPFLSGTTTTTIVAGAGIGVVLNQPATPLVDAFGSTSMQCAYSCSNSSSQGGCNTANQVAAYFRQYVTNNFAVSSSNLALYMYETSSSCWRPATFSLSRGSSCCPANVG